MFARVRYRLRQFRQQLAAEPLDDAAWAEVRQVLSPAEMALFQKYAASDRWHGVHVLRTLRAAGHDHPALQTAALLHDVGKTRLSLTIWERSLIVIAGALLPQRSQAWGAPADGPPVAHGWRKPFVIKARHAAWGAEMAAAAGSAPRAVALIRCHQDDPGTSGDPLLALLQWADELN